MKHGEAWADSQVVDVASKVGLTDPSVSRPFISWVPEPPLRTVRVIGVGWNLWFVLILLLRLLLLPEIKA